MISSTLTYVIIISVAFMLILGFLYVKRSKNGAVDAPPQCMEKHSEKEINRLEKLRQITLNVPLAEKTRPSTFAEIIGQENGLLTLEAALCGPNPQHVIIYGPPGVGKTAAARLALDKAKKSSGTPFMADAKMIEVDGTTSRFDERGIADPLLGSVHDPIYQGAGSYGQAGIPQPKEGAVSKAHGGILFIDEIGELHPMQLNKLLKVLEDRKVILESSYYQEENTKFPQHIHDIFQNGLPADFRLIAATTRNPEELPPALRSRCVEIFFRSLCPDELEKIAVNSAQRSGFNINEKEAGVVAHYAANGREIVNMIQLAAGIAQQNSRNSINQGDLDRIINQGHYSPHIERKMPKESKIGRAIGLGVGSGGEGAILPVEALVLPGSGSHVISGIVDEEEMGGGGHKLIRRSMAQNSWENVLTVLKQKIVADWQNLDFHINFPGGAPVDGPSAGITMATVLYSAIEGKKINCHTAMTGEISIHGDVLPVGGVTAKIEAAIRAGATVVVIPQENFQECYADMPIKIVPVATFDEVLDLLVVKDEKNSIFPFESLVN
ncbi:MAG: ATP-dependent protease LonB [Clostridiales bacterium]